MFKDATGGQLTQISPGILAWETPAGMQYVTRPDHPLYDHTQIEEITGFTKPGPATDPGTSPNP